MRNAIAPLPGKVVLFGSGDWRSLATQVMGDYSGQIELDIREETGTRAVQAAQYLVREKHVDLFMCTPLLAAELRRHLDQPVISIEITGFEILRALVKAREIASQVIYFSCGQLSDELLASAPALSLEVRQFVYRELEDAQEALAQLASHGPQVVIGSGVIAELARGVGHHVIFVHGEPSMRRAMNDAAAMVKLMRSDAARRDALASILRHLKEGVVAVDLNERVQVMNPAMAKLLDIDASHIVGRRLGELSEVLRLHDTLESGQQELEQIRHIGSRTVVTSRIPIRENGVQTGAVLTAQDSASVQRADRNLRAQARQRHFQARYELSQIVGQSRPVSLARTKAAHFALSDATVLVTGESGTGKEVFAQGIHNASRRRNEAFVAVNCPAIPEALLESELFGYEEGAFTGARRGGRPGLFEAAHGGTIFLDEIGDMPLSMQTRLLRVLQEREILRVGGQSSVPIDVRVIAATNCDLRANITAGSFRMDLYYRLAILHLDLPPLRERTGDLAELAHTLAAAVLKRTGSPLKPDDFLPAVVPHLEHYSWPGNVRELENVIERIVSYFSSLGTVDDAEVLRSVVPELFEGPGIAQGCEPDAMPPELHAAAAAPLRVVRKASEIALARSMLAECGGDHSLAASRLGISRTTLWRKLREAA